MSNFKKSKMETTTTSKERIRNRIKSLFERTANILPSYKEKKIELDSCDDFNLNGEDIMVIDVNMNGVTYIKDFRSSKPEEFLLDWDGITDLNEDFLKTIYDNLVGTIRNEYN
jgi:hypothetical protein